MSLGITIVNNDSGIEVVSIEKEDSNLQKGDIITEVNLEKVTDVDLFDKIVSKLEQSGRSSVLLKILRDEDQIWITKRFN